MGDHTGDGRSADGETPKNEVELGSFSIDIPSVTNDDFAAFVDDTGFRTESETFGYSAVFDLAFAGDDADLLGCPEQTHGGWALREPTGDTPAVDIPPSMGSAAPCGSSQLE